MIKFRGRFLAAVFIFILFYSEIIAQTNLALDKYIQDVMVEHNIQGLSAAIIKDGKIAWTKGYGLANVEMNIPFTPNTILAEIASLSKTITAAALMQLWEKDLFELDDPVNNYLPFHITNPYYPEMSITFRMLLTHTSSLNASYDIGDEKFDFNDIHFPKLGKHLFNLLDSKGDYYNDSICFYKCKPGTQWNYSGTGYALIGYLVELISKTPFDKYCDENIFKPLGMTHTSWHFSGVDTNIVGRPYHWSDDANGYADCGLFEYPTYPEGQLKTSIIDLAKFLWINMNDGTFGGKMILQKSTIKLMQSDHVSITDTNFMKAFYGFGWGHVKMNNYNVWGHHGRDLGIGTEMMFCPDTKTGIILLTNSEDNGVGMIPCAGKDDIVCRLFEIADTLNVIADQTIENYLSFPCEHEIKYWRNNHHHWPANALPMKLGNNFYDSNHVLALLEQRENTNASILLAHQLIAAKLNVANGSELSPIVKTIFEAGDLIGDRKLPMLPEVSLDSNEGRQMIDFAKILESYNNARMNKEKCDDKKP